MKPPPECQDVIDVLHKEITERVDPPFNKPMCSDLIDIEPEVSVSINSLVRAEVSGIVPEVNFAFGGRFSKEKRRAAKLKLTSQRSRRYSGSYLGIFLWEHGEFLFRRMLLYLHGDLGIRNGDRRILAFVTKHIQGTVSITTSEFRGMNAGFASPIPIAGCFRSIHESEENCANMGGVIGVHFIAFPVEKVEDHRWRFFRPIEIVDEENTGSDSSIRFRTASKWASGETGVRLHNANDSKDVSSDHLESSEDAQPNDSFATESSTTSQDSFSGQDYQVVSLPTNRPEWIDVDLGESVEDLARRQVAVANHYVAMKDQGKNRLISHLLGSAAAAGNPEAAFRLSSCSDNVVEPSSSRTNLAAPPESRGDCAMAERNVDQCSLPWNMVIRTNKLDPGFGSAQRNLKSKMVDRWFAFVFFSLLTICVWYMNSPLHYMYLTAIITLWLLEDDVQWSAIWPMVMLMMLASMVLSSIVSDGILTPFFEEPMFLMEAVLFISILCVQAVRRVFSYIRIDDAGTKRALYVMRLIFLSLAINFVFASVELSTRFDRNPTDSLVIERGWAMSPNPDFQGISDFHNESLTCPPPRFFSS